MYSKEMEKIDKKTSDKNVVIKTLIEIGEGTTSEIRQSNELLGDYSGQKVSAILKALIEEGIVSKSLENRRTIYRVVNFEAIDNNNNVSKTVETAPEKAVSKRNGNEGVSKDKRKDKDLVIETLKKIGAGTMSEIRQANNTLSDYSNQKVEALVKELKEEGIIYSTIENRRTIFRIVDFEITKNKSMKNISETITKNNKLNSIFSIKWTAVIIMVCMILVIGGLIKREQVFEECKNNAKQICEKHGINSISIDISYTQKYSGDDVYTLYVDGSFTDIDMSNIHNLVTELKKLMIDDDSILLLKQIRLNGSIYDLGAVNKNELEKDGNVVYTYVSEYEARMKEVLKTELPYEGLRVEYIGYTKLGEPDEVDNNYHLRNDRRYMVYTWKDRQGKIIAKAQASAKDGCVYYVWIRDDYKD